MAASAMGLSFMVPSAINSVKVTARWGRYLRAPSEIHETEQGRPRTVWRRQPVSVDWTPDLTLPNPPPLTALGGQDGVELRAFVRDRGPVRVVDLSLVNQQPPPASTPDTARLYQVEIIVTATDGSSAVFVGHNDPELTAPPPPNDPERAQLDLLYRHRRRYGFGRYCAVLFDVRGGEKRAWRLSTTCFPSADVPLTVPAGASQMPGVILDMARLGSQDLARDDLVRGLRPLANLTGRALDTNIECGVLIRGGRHPKAISDPRVVPSPHRSPNQHPQRKRPNWDLSPLAAGGSRVMAQFSGRSTSTTHECAVGSGVISSYQPKQWHVWHIGVMAHDERVLRDLRFRHLTRTRYQRRSQLGRFRLSDAAMAHLWHVRCRSPMFELSVNSH